MTPLSITKRADYSPEALQYAEASAEAILGPLSTTTNQAVPSASTQMSDLNAQLGKYSDQVGNTLKVGLNQLMSNMATFIRFSGGGLFSGGTPLPLPAATESLDLALRTYVTSASLQQNDWAALYSDSDHEVANDSDNVAQSNGEPAAVWESPSTGRSYLLKQLKPTAGVNDARVLQQIETNRWADPAVLFDGAFNCTASGRSPFSTLTTPRPRPPRVLVQQFGPTENHPTGRTGGPFVNLNFDGTLDLSCVSRLPIYRVSGQGCPTTTPVNGQCPFGTWG